MINSVVTSLRVKQLEKQLRKKYGLSQAEAREILREGRHEMARNNGKSRQGFVEYLKGFCEARLKSRPKKDDVMYDYLQDSGSGNFRPEYPAIEPSCSGTVALSKSDTDNYSAWGSKGSPTKSEDDSMTPPEQIFPLHKYMHSDDRSKQIQDDTQTDEFTKIQDERSSFTDNHTDQHACDQLLPIPESLLPRESDGAMQIYGKGIAEFSAIVEEPHLESRETTNVKSKESCDGPEMEQLAHLVTNDVSSASAQVFTKLESGTPVQPDTSAATAPSPNVHSDTQIAEESNQLGVSANGKAEELHQNEDVSVMTREEQSQNEVKNEEQPTKVEPRVNERVNHPSVPLVIIVKDPPDIEVLPFTDDEGFVNKREKRLMPIERLSL